MIRHLKEATDVVTSRKRLTKMIITLIYWGFWVLAIFGYWILWFSRAFDPITMLLPGFVRDMDVRRVHYLIVLPFTAVITSFMGAYEEFGRLRWIYVPLSGAMFMLFQILTHQLIAHIGNVVVYNIPFSLFAPFKWYFVEDDWFLSLILGLGVSAVGLWIGTFIRFYVRTQRKRKPNNNTM